jgi:hypothetical protein
MPNFLGLSSPTKGPGTVRKFLIAMVGAALGFLLGALVGTLCGMLWIFVFPPDRITGGFDIAFGAGLAWRAGWNLRWSQFGPAAKRKATNGNPRDPTILF